MEKINLPNGQVLNLPDNIDPQVRAQIAAEIKADFDIDINQTTLLGRAAELPKGIARGAIGLAADVPLGIAALFDVGDDGKIVKGLQAFKKDLREESPLAAKPGYEDLWTTKLSEGLGSFVPFLGAGMAGRALTRTPKPFFSKGYFKTPEFTLPTALAIPTGVAQQADRVQMAREMGEDVGGISETIAELAGGAIGITEVLPIGALLARTSKTALKDYALRDKLRSALIQGTQEGAQEVFASLAQDLTARGLYSDELPIGESLLDEFTVGGVIGAGADLVVNSFAGRRGIGNENLRQREGQLRQNRIQLQDEKRFDKAVEQGLVEEIQPVEIKEKPDIPIPIGEIEPLPNFEIIQDTQGNFNLIDTNKEGSPVLKTFEAEAEAKVAKEKELNKLRVKNLKIDIENALYNQGLINSSSGFDLGVTLLDPNSIELNPQSILNFDSKIKKIDRKDIPGYFTKKKLELKPTYNMQEVRQILAPKDLNRLQSDLAQQIFRQSEKRGEPSIRDDKSQVNVNNKYIKEIAASKNIELDFKDPAVQYFTRQVTGYDDISKVKNRGAKELFLARLHSLPKFNFKTKLPDFRPREYSAEDMANFVANMGANKTSFTVADLLKAGPTAGNKPATEQFVRDLSTSGRATKVEGTNKYQINPNYEFEVARKAEGFNETPEEFGARLIREGVLPQETIDQLIAAEQLRQEKYLPPKEVAPKMINFAQSVEEGRVNKFAREARKILDKAGLKETGVIISDDILSTTGLVETPQGIIKRDPKVYRDETSVAEAEYDRDTDIVFVSLNAVNPDGLATDAEIQQRINRIIDHEMIHALRAKDLINEKEYQFLRQEVKRRKVPESVDAEAFNKKETYYTRSKRINKQIEESQQNKDYKEEIYVEEAIAELYRNRFSQPDIPKKAETIFEKITQFFKSMGQALRRSGFDKSSEIFTAIQEGEVGKRQRGEIRTLREIDRIPLAEELRPIVEIDETRETGIDEVKQDGQDGTIATTVKTSTNSYYRDLKPGAVKGILVKGKVGSSIEDIDALYDLRKLSAEEIQADKEIILREFANKDAIEVAEWLSKNGPGKDYQMIADRIYKQLKKFKDKTGFNFDFTFYTGAGDARPGSDRRYLGRKRRSILGVSMFPQPEYDGGKTFRVYINNSAADGVEFNTILHELVHAATQAGTLFARYKGRTSFDKTNLVKGTEKLERIRSRLIKEIRKRKRDGENVDFYIDYGTKNIDELLAVGFTDREFQQFMESIEYAPKQKTLWESFVDAIREILGLPAKAGTVFSEFLKEGSRYLQFTTQEINEIAQYFTRYQSALEPLSTPVANVQRPQDIPTFSRQSIDQQIQQLDSRIYNLERRAEADRQYLSNEGYNRDIRRINQLKAQRQQLVQQRQDLPPEQPPLFSRAPIYEGDQLVEPAYVDFSTKDINYIQKNASKITANLFPEARKTDEGEQKVRNWINENYINPYRMGDIVFGSPQVVSDFVIRMPIEDFLKLTTSSNASIQEIKKEGPEYSILGGIKMLDRPVSQRFDPEEQIDNIPVYLSVDATGRVVGHEGRHRSALAQKDGAQTIPVHIKLGEYKNIKEGFGLIAEKKFKASGQIPLTLKDYGIDILKPQMFDGEFRKGYEFNTNNYNSAPVIGDGKAALKVAQAPDIQVQDIPTFSRAQLIPDLRSTEEVPVLTREDLGNFDNKQEGIVAPSSIMDQLEKSREEGTIDKPGILKTAVVNGLKNKKIQKASKKFLEKFTNSKGNLILYRSLNIPEGENIRNYGQFPQDEFASTTLDRRQALMMGSNVFNRARGMGQIRNPELLRYEVPMDRVIGYVPTLIQAMKSDYFDTFIDGLVGSGIYTQNEIDMMREDPDVDETMLDRSQEEYIDDEEYKFEQLLDEAEVIADIRGIKPDYQYSPGREYIEPRQPRLIRDVPLFSRSTRFATNENTSENKKLVEATERAEEIVKSTPNGEIPTINSNASDLAFKAFLDFNDTSNTSTPPDDIPTFSIGAIPEEYQDQVDKIGYTEPRKSFGARMIDFVSDPIKSISDSFKFVRTQLIDKLDLIDKKIIQASEESEEVRLANNTADTATMAALRMADRARGLFQGMLTRGFVSDSIDGESALANVNDLEISTVYNPYIDGDTGTGGLMQIIAPLYADPTVNREFLFKLYATSKRTQNFNEKGQLVDSPISREKAAENIRNIEQNYPSVVEVYNNYQNWNNQLITFAESKGLLDPQQAELWRRHSAYYPFYRKMVDDENILGPRIAAGSLPNNPLSIQITGSENPLDVDPIEAIARNSLSILTAALKNDGTSKLLRDLQSIGEAKLLESPEEIKRASLNRIFTFENGQKTFYSVQDPELFYGLQAVGGMNTDFITKILAMPASLLRDTVTRDPGFVVVNILRDTLSSAVTSGVPIGADGFTPVVDSFKNMFADMQDLEKFGVLGGYDFQNDEGTVKQFIDRSMRQEGLLPNNSANAKDMFFKLWDGLGALTTKSDGATRKAVYDSVYNDLIKRGFTEAQAQSEAAYQALEIINFGRRGLSPMFRTITAAIPFLNARIQGLDVLFRSFTGKYSTIEKLQAGESREEVRKRILRRAFTRGGFLMALTALYYMLVSDDDEYKNLRREVRDDNWIIPLADGLPALKIPIPFEVGMIFKTFPERFIDEFMGREIEPEPLTSVKRQLGTSAKLPFFDGGLGFQLLKPMAEVYQNKNTFTNTEIVPYYQQKLEAGLQARPSTNELLRVVGETFNVSPAKLEHLFRGYTGTLGGYVLDVADVTARGVTGTPLIPPNLNSIPVLRRLLQDIDRSGGGLQQQFYELRSEVDTAVQTMNKLRKDERFDEYSAYRSNMQGVLNIKGQVRAIERYMDNWRKRRDRLIRRTDISSSAKSELLKQMELERDRRLAIVPELRDRANIPVIRGV